MPRLLIVDDNESIHTDFKKVLTHNQGNQLHDVETALFGEDDLDFGIRTPPVEYEIDDAYQGEEAIAMVDQAAAEGRPYAVVFMDVRMPPGMDGVKAAAEIWRRQPETEMVICSAHSDYSWSDMLKEIGISDKLQFLRKPFDMVTVQQLALSCSRKWSLELSRKEDLQRLEQENIDKESTHQSLVKRNDELELMLAERSAELNRLQGEAKQASKQLGSFRKHFPLFRLKATLGGIAADVIEEAGASLDWSIGELHHLIDDANARLGGSEVDQKRVEKVSDTLQQALGQLNAFRQLARDCATEDRRVFNVWSYLNTLLACLSPSMMNTQIRVSLSGDDSVKMDSFPGLFAQIMLQMTTNAIAHAFPDGRQGWLEFEIASLNGRLHLVCRDDGVGMEQSLVGRLFEPTFGLGQDRRGYGLHAAREMARGLLFGDLRCESAPGKGSAFLFEAPLNTPNGTEDG